MHRRLVPLPALFLVLIGASSVMPAARAWGAFVQPRFAIATFWDPRLTTNTSTACGSAVETDRASLQRAKDAHFNLLTGTQTTCVDYPGVCTPCPTNSCGCGTPPCEFPEECQPVRVVQDQAGMAYALYIASLVGLDYLVTDRAITAKRECTLSPAYVASQVAFYNSLPQASRDRHYGYYYWDEPPPMVPSNPTCPYPQNFFLVFQYAETQFKVYDPNRLLFVNLLPRYSNQFASDAAYENYVGLYANGPGGRPEVLSFDHYPFRSSVDPAFRNYFYNLEVVRRQAGSRPFWACVMGSAIPEAAFVAPTEAHLRFMAFCPVAYGAKGLTYLGYERLIHNSQAGSGIIGDNGLPTDRYYHVQKINRFLEDVAGPVAMTCANLGAFHQSAAGSENPMGETIPDSLVVSSARTPIVAGLSAPSLLVGILKNTSSSDYYLVVVNKSLSAVPNVSVALRGNVTTGGSRADRSPLASAYTGSQSWQNGVGAYDGPTDRTNVAIGTMEGGDAVILRVVAPGLATLRAPGRQTDFDRDGRADIVLYTSAGELKIDGSADGFSTGTPDLVQVREQSRTRSPHRTRSREATTTTTAGPMSPSGSPRDRRGGSTSTSRRARRAPR